MKTIDILESIERRLAEDALPKYKVGKRTPHGAMVGTTPVHDPEELSHKPTLAHDPQLGELKVKTQQAKVWLDKKGVVSVQWFIDSDATWRTVTRYVIR